MKDPEVEPLAPELRALLETERAHRAPPAAGKARVAARLDAMLAGPGGPAGGSDPGATPAGSPAPPSGLPVAAVAPVPSVARALAIFVAGALTGGALVLALREPRVTVVERVPPAPPLESAPSQSVSAPRATRAPGSATEPSASAAPAPPVESAGTAARRSDSLAAERALLDPARTALGRGDGASALEAVHEHEARFAAGKLAEEREAIAVQALVVLHRSDEARARAARFAQRYPGSVLAPSVAAALESAP